jgi:prepilin-type N-terminal cleavage/methylation domain-containing protein
MRAHSHNGFTLIELSIVLVIIGLLVGGVLVGRHLIRAAELSQFSSEVQELNLKITVFKDKYGGKPGDLDKASQFFSSCVDIGGNTCNGDGGGTTDYYKESITSSLRDCCSTM